MKLIARMMLVASVAAAFVVPAGTAHAATAGVCTVQGSVSLEDRTASHDSLPLNKTPRDGYYEFTDTTLECYGTMDVTGTWDVTASGNTSGIPAYEAATSTNGETCNQGHSDGNGTLHGTSGSRTINGSDVTFTRIGPVVVASGTFSDGTNSYSWNGVFTFTPKPPTAAPSCLDTTDGLTDAALIGVAVISG